VRAVDADSDGLRQKCNRSGTLAKKLSMGDALPVTTGEREPGRKLRMWRKGLLDRFGFGERRQRFESEEIRGFGQRSRGENIDALAMKLDEIREGTVVISVIFGAVVKGSSIGAKRGRDQSASVRIEPGGQASEHDRTKKRGVGANEI